MHFLINITESILEVMFFAIVGLMNNVVPFLNAVALFLTEVIPGSD